MFEVDCIIENKSLPEMGYVYYQIRGTYFGKIPYP